MKNKIEIIAFDADDTLWVNEPYFQETEQEFCTLLADYLPANLISGELLKTELKNLPLYGYGAKGFILCMIETAHRISDGAASLSLINRILELGHALLEKPVELLAGVPEALQQLQGKYKLVMATKGDLLDQERKLKQSGLEDYFHHIEIMSDKKVGDYQKLLRQLNCIPENFLMLGNSIKSDIIPVLELHAYAAHIPYEAIWAHEKHEDQLEHPNFIQLNTIRDVITHLA